MSQLQIHKRIDEFLKADTATASVGVAQEFISHNLDAKRYFFAIADEAWLRWLLKNNFFNDLKRKAKDPKTYSYSLPELEYMTRMAEINPELVADIIISTPISKETFNPEVIDRFFWIIGLLPAEQTKRILPKILEENWVRLMDSFGRSGYQYQKIVEELFKINDFDALIILTKIILTVREKEELDTLDNFSITSKLFYLSDINTTGIFEAILSPNNTEKEQSLWIVLDILSKVVTLGKDKDKDVFVESEPFYMSDVDLFNLELNTRRHSYSKDNIENVFAVAINLIKNIFTPVCNNETEAKRLYETYIATLPDSHTLYRLKLFAITRCPDIFKKEIEESLFRVFKVKERYFDISGGAEYHNGLIAGFTVLPDTVKREYISELIKYFGATLADKTREEYRKRAGLKIVTYIKEYLTPDEIIDLEVIFGELPKDEIAPQPSMGRVTSGTVLSKTPFNPAEKTINELVEHLKTDATPKALSEKFKGDDFLNPRGAEGLGDAIKEDFKNRKSEYLASLNKFFDRKKIAPIYVYSILRQIEDMLRAKESFTDEEYVQILNFFDLLRKEGTPKGKEFKKDTEESYMADWITVHKVATDILLEILGIIKESQVFQDNKPKIFSLIKYMLSIKSSPDAEDDERESGEPAHVAVNSVRGQAYRAFVQFVYNEGNQPLSRDVKILYEHILDTDTSNAVRFTIGQFLASFYFRNVEFIRNLLPKILPKETGKEKLYFATWEGYLAGSLYKELFVELQSYYEYAIRINPDSYPERKYLKGLDESLAVHLALAYAHFDFKNGDPLFDLFWNTPGETRHHEFVSFIGRSFIDKSQASDKWFEENKVNKEKLIAFWSWILGKNFEPKTYSGFGIWINQDKEVIPEKLIIENLPKTLEKSQGDLDMDYGFTKKLGKFAEINPTNTLKCIELYLLTEDGDLNPHRGVPMFSIDSEIKDALIIIYKNPDMAQGVEDLIDKLVEKGSSIFWGLKDVLK